MCCSSKPLGRQVQPNGKGLTMNKLLTLTSFVASTTLVTAIASAQSYTPSLGYAGYYPGTGYYGGYGYHSSTAEEGILQGWASVLQAQGQANYWNSLAAVNYQEARARYLKNREQLTETYFRNRQLNLAAREAERPVRLSAEQYTVLAKKAAPARLDETQYNSTFGRLTWPASLMVPEFTAEREALDQLFGSRSPGDYGAGSAFYGRVHELTNSLERSLKNHVNELDAAEYVAAKKFLMGLSYEAQQPMVVRAVAVR
jgi:hypothetical protein